ncbi:chloride channel protein, partial [Ochromonadaceae sp. CCMP2298]
MWAAYCAYCVSMGLFACFITHLICPEATGGGLSNMKTILGGVVKPVLLSKRLILAKVLGLWFSLMAGLSVGREGPFVHISGAIADQFMKLSCFQHLRRQDSKRLEIIQCACASGVAATFGNAFGGVLFSIEFTASAYMVRTLPKAFLTSVVALVTFVFLGAGESLSLFGD